MNAQDMFELSLSEFRETVAPIYAECEAMLLAIAGLRVTISAASDTVSYRDTGFHLGNGSPLIVVSREEAVRVLDKLMADFCKVSFSKWAC